MLTFLIQNGNHRGSIHKRTTTFDPSIYMKMNFKSILTAPYPHENSAPKIVRSAIIIGCIVAGTILYFQPFGFGLGQESLLMKLLLASEYGLVTLFVTLIIGFVANGTESNWYKEKNWQVWKEIVMIMLHLAIITFANMTYTTLRFGGQFVPRDYLPWLILTCKIGAIPILTSVFLNQWRLSRKNDKSAADMNSHLMHPQIETQDIALIQLRGDNLGETIELNPEQILCIEAADNYVVVNYLKSQSQFGLSQSAEKISPTANFILRSTLRNTSLQLTNQDSIVQCHRSFLVNLLHVTRVSGNAAGLRLELYDGLMEVPVSRSMIAAVRAHLK